MSRFVTLAALATFAAAQLSVSQQCTTALATVATNPNAAACLGTSSLLPLLSGLTGSGSNTSIIAPVNNWLTNVCAGPACTNETLAAVVQNVTTGCSTELGSIIDLSPSLVPVVTAAIQRYYPTFRKVVCLKDGDTNCVTQTLTNVQNTVGDLTSVQNILGAVGGGLDNLPANITCTDCIKEAYNIIGDDVPAINPDAADFFTGKCGASFADGQTPSNVVQSASDATGTTPASTSSGAATALRASFSTGAAAGLAVSGLVVVSTVFTFLA